MIAGVECCQDVRRTVRVACRCVEVDHAVERAAAADPLVDGLTFLLLLRVVEALEGFRRASSKRAKIYCSVLYAMLTGQSVTDSSGCEAYFMQC